MSHHCTDDQRSARDGNLSELATGSATTDAVAIVATLDTKGREASYDLAPKFYPVLSSPRLLDWPGWAVVATGAGAEPSA
ncbi:hypothetical protein ABH972_008068 [Bradyrhizobium ottawaense]